MALRLRPLTKTVLLLSCFQLLLLPAAARQLVSVSYLGCYMDFVSGVRDLDGLLGLTNFAVYSKGEAFSGFAMPSLTRQLCLTVCSLGGFPYMGLQGSIGCYCGLTYGTYGAANESDCSYVCAGNASQMCGGWSRNSVYHLVYLDTRRFTQSAVRPVVTSGSSYRRQLYWTQMDIPDIFLCIFRCNGDSCQAVMFSKRTNGTTCYLLRFPLVPSDLLYVEGGFFVLK